MENLVFAYPNGAKILDGLSLTILPGQALGLSGRNGSGKTTLFRCVTGLSKPQEGIIRMDGEIMSSEKDFQKLRRRVGFVLQDADDQLFFPSVMEDMCFGPLNLGLSPDKARERARETLEALGIGRLADRLVHELSGGERKQVALAAIMAMRPAILLLDEPENSLDACAIARLAEFLKNLDCAKVVVSHDNDFLSEVCLEHAILENGKARMIY